MARLRGSLGWLICGALLTIVVIEAGVIALRSRPPAATPTPRIERLTLAQLQRLPEVKLAYPGSEVIYELGHEARGLAVERNPSYAGFGLGTTTPDTEVEAFYAQQLAATDWVAISESRSSAELRARAWRKGDLICRFAILDQRSPIVGHNPRFPTMYEIRVTNATKYDAGRR